jgi:hypothetical protein
MLLSTSQLRYFLCKQHCAFTSQDLQSQMIQLCTITSASLRSRMCPCGKVVALQCTRTYVEADVADVTLSTAVITAASCIT